MKLNKGQLVEIKEMNFELQLWLSAHNRIIFRVNNKKKGVEKGQIIIDIPNGRKTMKVDYF